MIVFRLIVLTGTVFFLLMVFRAVYLGKIKEAYALLWIAAGVVTGVLALVPALLNRLASLLGIVTPAFALILCILGTLLLLLFQITLVISGHHEKITRLLEDAALLREELEKRK